MPIQPRASLPDGLGLRIATVHGYGEQSYMLALSIALEHMGGEAWRPGYHVGT